MAAETANYDRARVQLAELYHAVDEPNDAPAYSPLELSLRVGLAQASAALAVAEALRNVVYVANANAL